MLETLSTYKPDEDNVMGYLRGFLQGFCDGHYSCGGCPLNNGCTYPGELTNASDEVIIRRYSTIKEANNG